MRKNNPLFISFLAVTAVSLIHTSPVLSDSIYPSPSVNTITWPGYEGAAPQSISIMKNSSQVFRFDRPIARVATSNPAICDVLTLSTQEILINAKDTGTVNVLVWDNEGSIATYKIESTLDLEKLQGLLHSIDPDATIKISPFNGTVAVYASTKTNSHLKQMQELVKSYDKDALVFASLKESKEILLEVRFAEINRNSGKEFKFDAETLSRFVAFGGFAGNTGASVVERDSSDNRFTPRKSVISYPLAAVPTENTSTLGLSYFSNSFGIQTFLKWLEDQNILKIIARPNLVAKDGEEASFIVGGEFPVPVATTDRISIDYKEFGTKLKFTPQVLNGDMINLKIETEVSELDFANTVTFSGTTIPSLIKRNQQTVAELRDNQSLVIGGLLTQKINRAHSKVPLLGDLPLIGRAFNADTFDRTDVELIVVVTPHIVKPFELNEQKNFYDPEMVSQAVRTYSPALPDERGDMMAKMMTQMEVEMLDQEAKMEKKIKEKFQKEEAKKIAKVSDSKPLTQNSNNPIPSNIPENKKYKAVYKKPLLH